VRRQKASNNIEVKRINRNRVFRYVNHHGRTSRPEIAEALGMSVPTVMQMVNELEERGLVQEMGELQSTGGRKAKAIAPVWDSCYSVGLDITRNHIGLLATNLSGQVLRHERIHKPFMNEESYYREIGEIFLAFLERAGIAQKRILGVGISIPGVVDSVENCIIYSHVLQVTDVSCQAFQKYIPYPCTLINDANAAGSTEGRDREEAYNLVYLSLSNSVGGAVISKVGNGVSNEKSSLNHIYVGDHWRSGEFGHMVLNPEGSKCYCGKKGCLDVYCSALRLAELAEGRLENFFARLEQEERLGAAWDEYLKWLALAVENLHMIFDCDVILGGYVGSFMEPYLEDFQKRVAANNIFEGGGSYVKVCQYRVEASAFGAALYYIDQYVYSI
jgi:N-acetylglucosamine repressor